MSADPDFSAFNAFGDIQQVRMKEAADAAPVAFGGLVRPGDFDGVVAFVIPDSCRNETDPHLVGGLIMHDDFL